MPKPPSNGSLIPVPEGEAVEVVLVRGADGKIVARTKEELELIERPPEERTPSTDGENEDGS